MDIQHFFAQLLKQKRGPQKMSGLEQLESITSALAAKTSERAAAFIKQLFECENIRNMEILDWTYSIPNPTKSPMCSKIMGGPQGGASFRCFECMESSSSCICAQCFIAGNHEGHNYLQYNSVNGCCDCGNEEAWNEKGFCPSHASIDSLECQIPNSTRSLFLEEGQLVLYLYFYILVKAPQRKNLLEQIGTQMFKFLAKASRENYEMKILASQLMQSRFRQEFPYIPMREHSIIQIFFKLPGDELKAHGQLINWIFQTFPVESMRKKTIQLYFQKMRNSDQIMTADTPLGGLNFQYMSAVKLINRMIKNKELEPMTLPHLKLNQLSLDDILRIPSSYKKMYEDVDYINNMKSAQQYHKMHLQMSNVAQLAGYRQVSKATKNYLEQQGYYPCFNVDQMFLKAFSKFVCNVRDDKQIVKKCIVELFHYIFNTGENYSSMAQERAFAMLTLAYLDGDLDQLFNNNVRSSFIDMLGVEKNKLKFMFETITKATLLTTVNWTLLGNSQMTSYERYFNQSNMQKYVPQFCDKIFCKTLILLGKDIFNYNEVILQLLKAKISQHEQREIQLSDNEEEKLIQTIKFGSFMTVAMTQITTVVRLTMDEVVINGICGIVNKQKIFQLFNRVVATFKHLNPKELKQLCLEMVNNQELFEQFITKHIIIEKGKFRTKKQVVPFQYLIYNGMFRGYTFPLPDTEVTYLTGDQTYPRFQQYKVYSSQFISLTIQKCMEFISQLADSRNPQLQHLLNVLVRQIFALYLIDRNDDYKYFFRTLLNPSLRGFFSKILLEQITLIEKQEEELKEDLEKIKKEEVEQFKAKREKVMQKKKMKEEMIRKNQQKMLNKFNKEIQDIQAQQSGNYCIYCKQEKEEPLSLIAYIGLTNLIEKNLLKHNVFHYFFSSCGHRIHPSCYTQANDKEARKYCFLCRQAANILMPQLADCHQIKGERAEEASKEFFSNMLTAIVNDNEIDNGKIGEFQNEIFTENMQILISSIAKELTYNGLHDFNFFRKKFNPLFQHILVMLNQLKQQQLEQSFEKIEKKWAEDNHEKHRLEFIQRYFQLRLQELFLNKSQEQSINQLKLQQFEQEQASKLFNAVKSKQFMVEINQLKYINPDNLFIKIPLTLPELHQYMGKCKKCSNITNNIFLCWVCGWSACIKCVKEIFKHVRDEHIDGAIIIGCSTGTAKFFKGRSIFEDSSIYTNYLGLSYSDANTFTEFGKAEKYNLNKQKEQQLRLMMLHYEVHQKAQLNSEGEARSSY